MEEFASQILQFRKVSLLCGCALEQESHHGKMENAFSFQEICILILCRMTRRISNR